jgi:hypothetical protein
MTKARAKTIVTTWELRSYDVLGNARDGYQVNDSYNMGEVTLRLKVETMNPGTEHAFGTAYPSDKQIRALFGVRCKLELGGDDLHIEVNRERDGYPIGEMTCTSHASLSPIRKTD